MTRAPNRMPEPWARSVPSPGALDETPTLQRRAGASTRETLAGCRLDTPEDDF